MKYLWNQYYLDIYIPVVKLLEIYLCKIINALKEWKFKALYAVNRLIKEMQSVLYPFLWVCCLGMQVLSLGPTTAQTEALLFTLIF